MGNGHYLYNKHAAEVCPETLPRERFKTFTTQPRSDGTLQSSSQLLSKKDVAIALDTTLAAVYLCMEV
jgi:hypothetical protein